MIEELILDFKEIYYNFFVFFPFVLASTIPNIFLIKILNQDFKGEGFGFLGYLLLWKSQ